MRYMNQAYEFVSDFFRSSDEIQLEDAWVDADDHLTEDELKIQRAGQILLWGAMLNGLVSFIFLLIGILFASQDTFHQLQSLLISGYSGSDSSAWILLVLISFANMTVTLIIMIGVIAQDIWTIFLMLFWAGLNLFLFITLAYIPAIFVILPLIWAAIIISKHWRYYRNNPVMVKELRGRMRGVRAFAIISIYLALMSSFTLLLYLIRVPIATATGIVITGSLGRDLFRGVVGIELMLILFIVPALTAGAITSERERKTYDLLQSTLLAAPNFLIGKLQSAMGYIVLLLLAAIPLQSIAFLFGGVSESEVILAFLLLTVSTLVLGAAGIYFSTRTDRTMGATVRTYVVALTVIFAMTIFVAMRSSYVSVISGIASNVSDNPIIETISIYADMIIASLSPITAMHYTQQILIDHQSLFVIDVTLSSSATGQTIPVLSPWILYIVIYLFLTAVMLIWAMRRMRRLPAS
ncbi:hypothetical protein MASR2M15_05270 [Anaerolineales bacterium]